MTSDSKILMMEESPVLARCYTEFLSNAPFEVDLVATFDELKKYLLNDASPKVILLDFHLHNASYLDKLAYIFELSPSSNVVVITGESDVLTSKDVIRAGAFDYLEKPFNRDRLGITMTNAVKQLSLRVLSDAAPKKFCGFWGKSVPMQKVYQTIERASASNSAPVFITGQSGTGKEVCAQSIHELSVRKSNELVVLNCAAIPKDLIESEIFGHVKGAFTGAVADRIGAARKAHGGTLFLDEIGEMDMELQSKLLRFIQTGRFCRVGSGIEETVDVRFVCATNRNPMLEIEKGNFREDLYYRLNVVPIEMPVLNQRADDVLLLADKFIEKYAKEEEKEFNGISDDVKKIFLKYDWPGNVRQLINVIRNVVVLHDARTVTVSMLPPPLNDIQDQSKAEQQENIINIEQVRVDRRFEESRSELNVAPLDYIFSNDDIPPLAEVEKMVIERAIALSDGNITQAAKRLKINPSTIHRKRQQWCEQDCTALS